MDEVVARRASSSATSGRQGGADAEPGPAMELSSGAQCLDRVAWRSSAVFSTGWWIEYFSVAGGIEPR